MRSDHLGTGRIRPLDALRGIAISGVVLFHLGAVFGPVGSLLKIVCAQGFYGVQLFFIVSAITMCEMWERRSGEANPTTNFYIRRFFRIAGPFWLAIIFYRSLDGLAPSFWAPDGISTRQIITTTFFVHALWPDTINCVVPGGWSIGVEMLFYLLFPLLVGLKGSPRLYLALGFALYLFNLAVVRPAYTAALSGFEHGQLVEEFLYFQLFNQGPIFLIGIASYRYLTGMKVDGLSIALVLAWLATAFLLKRTLHMNSSPYFWGAVFTIAAAAFCVLRFNLTCAPLNLFGEISYSVYLSHFAIIRLIELVFTYLHFDKTTYLSFTLGLLVAVLFCVIVGIFMRATVERPSSRLAGWITSAMSHDSPAYQ
jgi:peptidoglycan/LPS O-acetylase OafA/YrhL